MSIALCMPFSKLFIIGSCLDLLIRLMMSGEYDGDGFEGDLFLLVTEILLCV